MRNAASWPFQICDCHIWNHSPPTTMKPKNQNSMPAAKPRMAVVLARLNCAAGAFTLADTARLLKLRGQAMQAAVPVGVGAMCALLGADIEKLAKLKKAA